MKFIFWKKSNNEKAYKKMMRFHNFIRKDYYKKTTPEWYATSNLIHLLFWLGNDGAGNTIIDQTGTGK